MLSHFLGNPNYILLTYLVTVKTEITDPSSLLQKQPIGYSALAVNCGLFSLNNSSFKIAN